MKPIIFICVLFALFDQFNKANGLYFHIRETERKCFIEEVPDETLVVGEQPIV